MPPPIRKKDGPLTEGARLLWQHLQGEQSALASRLGVDAGLLNRWLHGERKPGREWALKLQAQLSIPAEAWSQKPTERWSPPSTRKRRAA